MPEILGPINAGELVGLVAVIGGMMIPVIAILATQWRRVRLAEIEAGLKQQMLEKGMSAAEIDQVIKTSREPSGPAPVTSTGNAVLDKTALAQQMIDNGYEAEDIERVLKAYQHSQNSVVEQHITNSV